MSDFKTLTPSQVLAEIVRPEVKLVDVREDEERAELFIPGSLHIPLYELEDRYDQELSPDDEIILYCQHGIRSEKASNFLTNHGFSNVSSMAGGISAWQGPTESE